MAEFKLSAVLEGHEDDVRSVSFPRPDLIVSASRDATVRLWKQLPDATFDGTIALQGSAFINSVTYLEPSTAFADGLIVSGGKDTIIDVREPGKPTDANAERLLLGHAHNVCALDASPDGKWIVSGSWDASARIWSVGKWECKAVLEGHEGSVWAVLAYDNDTVITASADNFIRVYSSGGKLLQTIRGSSEVLRALCKVQAGHTSGAEFASAGNDGIIKLWQLRGRQVGKLRGHESFIYSLASLPNGDLVSSGEDRTVRIWNGTQCIQTITHPAISVWCVSVCPENGDIVSGASDRIARVFTRSTERQANAQTIEIFDESVKASSIPQQQVGEVNKEKLPGPEFLTQKSGTKDGQVQMIREANGSVTAHTWSVAAQQWANVGTVVDAVGSSGKKITYAGEDYDYVFDVDIEDGKPPLKLPYNLSQNPYEAATKFIEDNELAISYLDQVANFITTNTQGATIGTSTAQTAPAPGSDPWGSEARYRPGDVPQESACPPPPSRPKVVPQKQYLSITAANHKTIQKKLEELNEQLLSAGEKDSALNPEQIATLRKLTSRLEKDPKSDPTPQELEIVVNLALSWPPASRLPALDLLRLVVVSSSAASYGSSDGSNLVALVSRSGVFADAERPNNQMLALRAFVNLFESDKGRQLADDQFDQIHALVQPLSQKPSNRNLTIALATLYINYSVLCTSDSHSDLPSSLDRGLSVIGDLTAILQSEKDSEATYRALVALGTFLVLGEDVQSAARDIYDVAGVLRKAESGVKDPRIKAVGEEIRKLLA